MFGFKRRTQADRGREAAIGFLRTSPDLAEIREQWGASRYANDEYDRAWQAVIRPHLNGLVDEAL